MSITSFVVLAICAAAATTAKGEGSQEHTYMFALTPGYSSFFTKDVLDTSMFRYAQGKVNLTDSVLDKDTYTAYVEEEVGYGFGTITCQTIGVTVERAPGMCYIGAIYDDSKVYCNFTGDEEHATKCASTIMTRNVYEFELTADGTTPEGIKFINENVLNITNASSIVDYAFTQNTTYFVAAAEKAEGDFGNTVAEAFGEDATFKNYVTLVKSGNTTYYARIEEHYVNTTYNFGFSIVTPANVTKETIDALINTLIGMPEVGGTATFVSSTFSGTLYTVTIMEPESAVGTIPDIICGGLSDFVKKTSLVCHITRIGYDDVEGCYIRTIDTCADIEPGAKTAYEVNYYGNLTSQKEIDTFFEDFAEHARDVTLENYRLVNSSYSEKTYKPIVYEPVVGYFAEQFCDYISNASIKCDFGPLKANGQEYCKFSDCPNNGAFGFTPVVFLMALIIAFLF